MENKQKQAGFVPTAEQIAFAEAFIMNMGNISRACEAIGDPGRNRYYDKLNGWHYQEGFEEWLSEYSKKAVLKRVGRWYLIAEAYAQKGSFQHLNLLMQQAKECAPNMGLNVIVPHGIIFSDNKEACDRSAAKRAAERAGVTFKDVEEEIELIEDDPGPRPGVIFTALKKECAPVPAKAGDPAKDEAKSQ